MLAISISLVVIYLLLVIVRKIVVRNNDRVYISGAISSLDYFTAKENFERVENMYKHQFNVVNPMNNYDITKSYRRLMYEDLKILFFCKYIYMQLNWKTSKGAKIERIFSKILFIKIIYQL